MRTSKNQRQNKKILKYLQAGNKITAYEALKLVGCLRLAARMDELSEMGFRFKRTMIAVEGSVIAEYELENYIVTKNGEKQLLLF